MTGQYARAQSARFRDWNLFVNFLSVFAILVGTAVAQAPVNVTVDTKSHGFAIPTDFSGLSFESGSERLNNAGVSGYLFSPTNSQAVTLFQNLSLKSLRVGGGSVDDEVPAGYTPDGFTGIDNLFGFANVTGMHVIYSLRLLKGSIDQDTSISQYIWQRYQPFVSSFSIGNEPDWNSYHKTDPLIKDYPTYLSDWRNFANSVLAVAPGTTFSGPDTGAYSTFTYYNGESWTQHFADDEVNSGLVSAVNQHMYVGGSFGKSTAQNAIDFMLSPAWVNNSEIGTQTEGAATITYTPYPWLYNNNLVPVQADNLPYRLTESNDFLGGVPGASNAFSSALWTLDYMQWWAAHGAAGVNFHNKQWIMTDTIIRDSAGNYQTSPKGYGIKAFDLGGHGYVEPVSISNPNNINVTAYAMGDSQDLYVTIVNKTHDTSADSTDATVTITPSGFASGSASEIVMTDGTPGDPSALSGMLGGAPITNNSRWLGVWSPITPDASGNVKVTVQASTAVVVKIHAAGEYSVPAAINQNGALELFGTSANGDIWHIAQQAANVPGSSPSNWSGWSELGGGIRFSGGAVVAKNQDKTLEAFAASAGGDVYHNRQATPGGSWGSWTDLGGTGVTSLVPSQNADGSLIVLGIGSNSDVWADSESAPEVGWSGWSDLSGASIQPGFVAAQNPDGLVEVVGVDGSGNVLQDTQTATGVWSGWSRISGQQLTELAIAKNLDGRLELYGLDSSGNIWDTAQTTPGGDWGRWSLVRGKQFQPGFAVGQNQDGSLVLFGVRTGSLGRGAEGVWSITRQGSTWGEWVNLGGSGMDSRLVVSNTADGRIQLFGIGPNQDVWSDWQTGSGEWNGWTDFGGNGIQLLTRQ